MRLALVLLLACSRSPTTTPDAAIAIDAHADAAADADFSGQIGQSCTQGSTVPTSCAGIAGWCVVESVGGSPTCRPRCMAGVDNGMVIVINGTSYGCPPNQAPVEIVGNNCYCR